MAGDPWDGDTVVQPAQPTYAAGTPNAGQQVTPAQGAYYRSAGAPSGQGQPGLSAANPSYDTPTNAGGDATYHVTTDGRLSAPAGQPGGAINLQPATGADPWDTDQVLHTSGYEKALVEQRAASAQAGSSPLTAGIDQAGDALLNGLTLNHADWAKGGLAYAGAYLRSLTGDHSVTPGDAWNAEQDLTREQDAQFAKDHPLANVALEAAGGAPIGVGVGKVVGAAAGPLAEALGTPRWLAGYGLGVPADAAVGAAYGAGADKAAPGAGAAQGALVGAGAGVVAPVVGAIGGTLLKAGRDAAGGIVAGVQDAMRGKEATLSPAQTASAQQAAARYLAGKLDGAGVTPADIATSPLAPRGATVAEAMGPDAVADAASLIRRPGQGAQLARDTLQPRMEGRTDRLLSDVRTITGVDPVAAQGGVEGIVAQGQSKAAPLYAAVRADATRYMTRDMRQVLQTPAGQDALSATYRDLRNGVPAGGPTPEDVGITADGDGRPMVAKGLRPLAIDMLKRNLDEATRFQPFGGAQAGNANQAVDAARDAWVSSARQAVPGYADALDAAGDYKTVQSAYKASQGMLFGTGSGRSVQDAQNVWSNLGSDAERDAVRSRFAADIMAKAEAGTLTPGVLQKPGVYGKLTTAFGQDQADALVKAAGQEGSLSATGSRMMPGTGSITADALNHGDAQDEAMDTLRAAGHVVHRLKEGRVIPAIFAGVAHAAEKAGAAVRTPFNQATRDELARLYLGDASAFGSTFQPPSQAAGYLAPGAFRTWMAPGSAGAGATLATRREAQ